MLGVWCWVMALDGDSSVHGVWCVCTKHLRFLAVPIERVAQFVLGLDGHRVSGGEQLHTQDLLVLWETAHYNVNIPCKTVPLSGEGTSHVPSNPMSDGDA